MSTILEIKVPTVGESITEVTIGAWNKKSGDFVNKDEVLCEIESDKATFELPAEASGILEIIAEKGKVVAIGTVICKIQVTEGVSQQSAQKNEKNKDEKQPEQKNQTVQNDTDDIKKYPSPAADKILSEKGIDSKEVDGTGKDGRITKEDALKAEKKSGSIKLATDSREDRREKMTSLRKTIAKRLVAAKNETAMLTTFNEVDMKPIMDIRAKYKDKFKEKYEINLGFMSFFVKACCAALQEFPAVNAYIDGDELVYHNYCDISVAVSTPRGLVVPVIRHAESLSFDGIEKEIALLALKARDNKLTIPEMTGGTFTITNGGVFGSMMSTPIINPPQSAILGMHNIVERPVVVNGEIVIRPMMYLALSYDHRIIDGRESVSFLVRIKQLLEDPSRLLLGI